jgi:hypothetical protein
VQTLAGCCSVETTSDDFKVTTEQLCSEEFPQHKVSEGFSICYQEVSAPQAEQLGSWLEPTGPASTYLACVDMIRCEQFRDSNTTSVQLKAWFQQPNAGSGPIGVVRELVLLCCSAGTCKTGHQHNRLYFEQRSSSVFPATSMLIQMTNSFCATLVLLLQAPQAARAPPCVDIFTCTLHNRQQQQQRQRLC